MRERGSEIDESLFIERCDVRALTLPSRQSNPSSLGTSKLDGIAGSLGGRSKSRVIADELVNLLRLQFRVFSVD